jgi:hypothetical protein
VNSVVLEKLALLGENFYPLTQIYECLGIMTPEAQFTPAFARGGSIIPIFNVGSQ